MYVFLLLFQTRIDINKREIDHAFAQRPNSLIIYIFGQGNGRIHDEDAIAFNSINKAYPLNIQSLLLVINGLPAVRPKNYEGEVMLMLQDIIQVPAAAERVCFLNQIDRENMEERLALRKQLVSAIIQLSPKEHIKMHDIHLQADEVAMLKKQILEMTKAFQENKIFFENEIREQQQRYDGLIVKQKAEAEHFQSIIDQQIEETKKMKEMQLAQVRQMEERMKEMQAEHQRLTQEMANKSQAESAAIVKALEQSNQAQAQLREQITALQNRQPPVVYNSGKKRSVCILSSK
jgi:uncharacterized small protein (DUF1192 family)